MPSFRLLSLAVVMVCLARGASAQQRPLVTEDPEPIGAGRVLVEGGVEYARDAHFPVSGMQGNLWRVPLIGVSVGVSSIAEIQLDGGPYDRLTITGRQAAPLSSLVTVTDPTTHDVNDLVVGMKIRVLSEGVSRPAIGVRFATKLPNSRVRTGLGLNTTDFYASLLGAKTVESVRFVGNLGLGILGDPTTGQRQNDDLTYGLSVARALTQQTELVAELNGRVSTREGSAFPGTESRGVLKMGGRYTHGSVRFDAGASLGLTPMDPSIGLTAGFTYVFDAFTLP
jgi:hypothetical protein